MEVTSSTYRWQGTHEPLTSPFQRAWYYRRVRRLFLPLLFLTYLNLSYAAPPWTLQTSAFSSAESAASAVAQLRALGFDAYSEPGEALTRVRVGCFLDRANAEDVAASLARYERGVQVVPLNRGAKVSFCVRREAGFFLPQAWGVASSTPEHVTFWVGVAGRRYLRFNGRDWQIYQNTAEADVLTSTSGLTANEPLTQTAPIRVNSLVVGLGRPLWKRGRTLVVQNEEAIFTLSLSPPGEDRLR